MKVIVYFFIAVLLLPNIHTQEIRVFAFSKGFKSPPFLSYTRKEPSGIDADLIREIAQDLKFKIKWTVVEQSPTQDPRIEYLLKNKVDISIGLFSITKERAKKVQFTIPYFKTGLAALILKDSNIKTIEDLKGHKVLAFEDRTPGDWAKKNLKHSTILGLSLIKHGYQFENHLLHKDVSAWIHDYHVLLKLTGKDQPYTILGDQILQKDFYGFATSLDNKELCQKLNQSIKKLREKGILNQIFEKYQIKSL